MAGKADRAAIEKAQQVLYEEGTKLRQEVFGLQHIASSKSLSSFQQPLQTMAVTAGWAMCWTRPGLERKTRSLLCLVMLAVLGRDHELGVHVRGAIHNKCTEEEIREALFQVSVYAGVPAALNATRVAETVLDSMKSEGQLE
ncbi:4-carboxymuconolactone decarboxylase [Fonsecaea erecta]|uniref:4-carboxymuconolactone decarboxylase n=1 Tax=Fonsecaea erecta TaxID=1367422 RepID=A0A178ZFU1_9EURO|nr:4-carboxymuconolactone decarboxylase [Fonsecaea erecta]OAP57925.1 4-carboxymuconolactone decarboxylase [Fonsecaea erecta]